MQVLFYKYYNSSDAPIRKVASSMLSRCFAANFAHVRALNSSVHKHKNMQAHFVSFMYAWLNCSLHEVKETHLIALRQIAE